MLLKYLLVAIIFYYIVKTSGNLMRAIRSGVEGEHSRDPRFGARGRSSSASPTWQTRSNERSSARNDAHWEDDVEDAKWEDL